MKDEDLPWGWQRVTGESCQFELDLFSRRRDRLLAIAMVSLDELGRWREKGWISFDATNLEELAEPLVNETIFIRNLARSGLSDEQIGQMLAELEPPYRIDPSRTAYSFAYGWVQPPPVLDGIEIAEFVESHLRRWIDDKVKNAEVELLQKLEMTFSIAALRAEGKRNEREADAKEREESEKE